MRGCCLGIVHDLGLRSRTWPWSPITRVSCWRMTVTEGWQVQGLRGQPGPWATSTWTDSPGVRWQELMPALRRTREPLMGWALTRGTYGTSDGQTLSTVMTSEAWRGGMTV